MPTTVDIFGPTKVFGPSTIIDAHPNIASPQNLPWHWLWTILYGSDNLTFFTKSTTDTVGGGSRLVLLYNDDLSPNLLINANTLTDGVPMKAQVTVTDDNGFQVNPPVIYGPFPWNNTVWAHRDNLLLHQWTQKQLTGGGGGDDRLDQILAAVYRTWPDA